MLTATIWNQNPNTQYYYINWRHFIYNIFFFFFWCKLMSCLLLFTRYLKIFLRGIADQPLNTFNAFKIRINICRNIKCFCIYILNPVLSLLTLFTVLQVVKVLHRNIHHFTWGFLQRFTLFNLTITMILRFRFCRALLTMCCLRKKNTWGLSMTSWRATLIRPGGERPGKWLTLCMCFIFFFFNLFSVK